MSQKKHTYQVCEILRVRLGTAPLFEKHHHHTVLLKAVSVMCGSYKKTFQGVIPFLFSSRK